MVAATWRSTANVGDALGSIAVATALLSVRFFGDDPDLASYLRIEERELEAEG